MGGLIVVNLYAYRATKPEDLRTAGWPVGPFGDEYIRGAVNAAEGPVVVAWGANAPLDRAREVLDMIPDPQCLGYTKGGAPRHPLYVPASLQLAPYRAPGDP